MLNQRQQIVGPVDVVRVGFPVGVYGWDSTGWFKTASAESADEAAVGSLCPKTDKLQ